MLALAVLPVWGAATGRAGLVALARPAAQGQFVFVAAAFGCLAWSFYANDFSVLNVVENSHSLKPLLYKISGVWGNHEGSMLLWVLILALFGALVALFGGNLPASLKANVLGVQSWIDFIEQTRATSGPRMLQYVLEVLPHYVVTPYINLLSLGVPKAVASGVQFATAAVAVAAVWWAFSRYPASIARSAVLIGGTTPGSGSGSASCTAASNPFALGSVDTSRSAMPPSPISTRPRRKAFPA